MDTQAFQYQFDLFHNSLLDTDISLTVSCSNPVCHFPLTPNYRIALLAPIAMRDQTS